jgi:hypothetical protein
LFANLIAGSVLALATSAAGIAGPKTGSETLYKHADWGSLTISLASLFLLLTMVYSKGRRKSFWNRKCDNSSFSKKFIASCRSASSAKKLTFGLLWQQT